MTSTTPHSHPIAAFATLLKEAEAAMLDNRLAEATALWAQVVAQNPVVGTFWGRLGLVRLRAQQYAEAIPAFQRALDLGAGFPDQIEYDYNYPWQLVYDIARCHGWLGDTEAALTWLARALTMGKRNRAALRDEEAFRALHGEPRFQALVGFSDPTGLSRDEGWRADLALLAEECKRLHYEPFAAAPEAEFDALVRELHDRIPELTDRQVIIGLMRVMRQLGDGHSFVALWELGDRFPDAPLSLYIFEEGLFITATAPEHADLLGSEVTAIGDHPVGAVMAALDGIISRDNAMTVKSNLPGLMRKPAILHGLGLLPDDQALPLTIRDAEGQLRQVAVPVGQGEVPGQIPEAWASLTRDRPEGQPRYLRDIGPYWFDYLADEGTLYFQYRAVQPDPNEAFDVFCERLFAFIEANEVRKLVIDLRYNGGGNTFMHFPLFRGLARSARMHGGMTLFVLIGRQTFSAAMNGTIFLEGKQLEWNIPVVFVGEPTGSSPNFVGETVFVTLPYSRVRVSISDLYWQTSWPMDNRIWLAPHIYVPPTFSAYREGRDLALEAVIAYDAPAL